MPEHDEYIESEEFKKHQVALKDKEDDDEYRHDPDPKGY